MRRYSLHSLGTSLFGNPKEVKRLRPRGKRLGFELLESRIVPDSRFLGNLEFRAAGDFAADGSIQSEVQVGFANPGDPQAFVSLVTLPGGVTVNANSATVNAGVVAGGLTFNGNLTFTGDTSIDRYTLTGGASINVGGSNISLSLGQPDSGSAGLVLQNGTLAQIDATLNSTFSFSQVTFATQDLRLTYDASDGARFTVTGDASVNFMGAGSSPINATVHFGQTAGQNTPGLVIQNGQLRQLFVSVTSNFRLAGLDISTDRLGLFYNPQADSFAMYGNVRVSTAGQGGTRVLDNFGVTLGEPDGQGNFTAPGILIVNGTLENINIALNGSLNIARLQVMPNNLRVNYTRATGVLQLTGGLTVSVASRFNGSVSLPNGGITIDTNTGMVRIQGLLVQVSNTRIGPVGIRNAFVMFTDNGDGSFNLSGGAMVDLPAGLSVDGGFVIVNGRLRQIHIDVTRNPGIALGNTGVFVNRVLADVNNLDNPDQLQVTGTVGLTAGPSFRIAGEGRAFASGSLTVNLDVGAATLKFSGRVDLIGGLIPAGNGFIMISFDPVSGRPLSVMAHLEQNYYAGFFRTTLDFALQSSGNIDLTGRAEVRTPDFLTFSVAGITVPLGGISLASAELRIHFEANDPGSSTVFLGLNVGPLLRGELLLNLHGDVNLSYHITTTPEINLGLFTIPATSIDNTINLPGALPDLFPGGVSAPPSSIPAATYQPTVIIDSVEIDPETRDAIVTYHATTEHPGTSTLLFGIFRDQGPQFDPSQRFTPTAPSGNFPSAPFGFGPQTYVIPDVDQYLVPGVPVGVGVQLIDTAFSTPVFAPLNFTLLPPIPANPLGVSVPFEVTAVPGNPLSFDGTVQVIDDASSTASPRQVNVFLTVEGGTLSVPSLPSVQDYGTNNSNRIVLTGTADDINFLLTGLTYTAAPNQLSDDELVVGINRAPSETGYVEDFVAIFVEPFGISVFPPPAYDQNTAPISLLGGVDIMNPTDNFLTDFSVQITNYEPGADDVSFTLPAGSPITGNFDYLTGLLTFNGVGSTEDYRAALSGVEFFTADDDPVKSFLLQISDDFGNFDAQLLDLQVNVTGPAQFPFQDRVVDDNLPVVDAGVGLLLYFGGPAVPVSPGLTVTYTGESVGQPPLGGATVAFTNTFDPTSDVLTFADQNGISGSYDMAAGVLTLTGQASPEQYQQALAGVGYMSLRANPINFMREVTFTITNGVVESQGAAARTHVAIATVPVPPILSAMNDPLTVPQGSDFVQVFSDFTLSNPDAGLPPPPFVLGKAAPGTTLARASVVISTNYIPGEDLLAFTTTGNIIGQFFADTGELLFTGDGTLEEYQAVIQSVQYRNANVSPSTADRLIVATLDDGTSSGTPLSASRTIQPQADPGGPMQTAGTVAPLTIATGDPQTSLGLEDLDFAPKAGETALIFTLIDIPARNQGQVMLGDGSAADVGLPVTLDQIRGAVFVPAAVPVSGTSSFTFTVAGVNPITGAADPNPLVVVVTITTLNAAPVVGDDMAATATGASTTIDVMANDTDANADILFIREFSSPANGTVTRSADQLALVYTPNAGFNGTDTFTYLVDDQHGGTGTGSVTVTVSPDGPVSPTVGFGPAVTQNEGNAGTTDFVFPITLSVPAPEGGVVVQVRTIDGTGIAGAAAPGDFAELVFQPVTIAAGQTSGSVTVVVNGDADPEVTETFTVSLSLPPNSPLTLGSQFTQTGTIVDDDGGMFPPIVAFGPAVTQDEGNEGTTGFVFPITLTEAAPAGGAVVLVSTADGTATTADNDYVALSNFPVTIPAGQQSATVSVVVNGDATTEPDESFTLNLTLPAGSPLVLGSPSSQTGTIRNDEGMAGVIQFTTDFFNITESDENFLTLTRTGTAAGETVTVTVMPGTGPRGGSSNDVTATSTTVTFAAGQTTATAAINPVDDTRVEGPETFFVTLTNPGGGAVLGDLATATVTVQDNDGTSNQRFVNEAFIRLMNRQADPNGLDFWAAQLDAGMSRFLLGFQIASSRDARAIMVNNLYQQLLGRDADPIGLSASLDFLALGGTRDLLASILVSSPEYFASQGGTVQGFLNGLFTTILNRPFSQAVPALDLTTVANRQFVALSILQSLESDLLRVDDFYQQALGFTPDAAGRSFWAGLLQQGISEEAVLAAILSFLPV